jgi:hypothetical protein
MPENQQHGFLFEDDIKKKVFNDPPPALYTAPHDVDRCYNPQNPNENISLKATGRPTVDMADALRVYGYEEGVEHTAIVVQYEQQDEKKVLTHVYELDLMQRELLYGRVTRQDIEELNDLVRSMPRGRRDPEIDRAITAKKKELNASRAQCASTPRSTATSSAGSSAASPSSRAIRGSSSLLRRSPSCEAFRSSRLSTQGAASAIAVFRNRVASSFERLRGPVVLVGKTCASDCAITFSTKVGSSSRRK